MDYKFSLKGGSFSSTDVVEYKGELLVRKKISFSEDREYGFYRWYGQYKKMLSMSKKYPELIPAPNNFKVDDKTYSYTIPYYKDFINAYEYLNGPSANVEKFANGLFKILLKFQENVQNVPGDWLKLYWNEEVSLRIDFAYRYFKDIFDGKPYHIDGRVVEISTKEKLVSVFNSEIPININLVDTHGNLTLENILYNPKEDKILFIDLYEENYFDVAVNDISQLQQSCKYFYEDRNIANCKEIDRNVVCNFKSSKNLYLFNDLLEIFIHRNFSKQDEKLIKLFAASQFYRMIPFKFHHSKVHAKYFFLLACKIMEDFRA